MNKAEELHNKILGEMGKYKVPDAGAWIRKVDINNDFYREMTNVNQCCKFYQWLACLIRVVKPKNVCELGADRGGSAIFILSELNEVGKLYSVDTRNGWEYVPAWDNRITKIISDDLSPKLYTDTIPSKEIDIWFIDSQHTKDHVRLQLDNIKPYLRPGSIIINHDVNLDDIASLLKTYPWDFWQDNNYIFANGVGLHVI